MYATAFNSVFFNALVGKNRELIERSIIALYGANYGNNSAFIDDMDREDVKSTILNAIGELDWYDEETNDKIEKDSIKANFIIAKLKACGWIDFPTNRIKATKYFAFTKYGKKFAQLIYSLQDEDIDLSKQRNVRHTKFSLEAYKEEKDPQHLIDAVNTSKEIISDLTDSINDIKELKNILMVKARESIDDAGEKFIDFLTNKFRNDTATRFDEDSVDRYQHDIKDIINSIRNESSDEKEKRIAALNKGKYISFFKKNESFEKILLGINDRILNACETKLPTLKNEVQSYINNGGTILRQTNALMMNENKHLYKFVTKIKQSNEKEKNELLDDFANKICIPKLRMFDTNGIKIRNKVRKKRKDSYIDDQERISLEIIIESIFHKKLQEAFSYTQEEQQKYIEFLFNDTNIVSSEEFPIEKAKDILLSLYSIDYIAKNRHLYKIEKRNSMDKTIYYEAEGFTITRKKQ